MFMLCEDSRKRPITNPELLSKHDKLNICSQRL